MLDFQGSIEIILYCDLCDKEIKREFDYNDLEHDTLYSLIEDLINDNGFADQSICCECFMEEEVRK